MTGVCRRACVTGINRRGDGASRADRASKTAAAYILNSAVPTALYTTTAAVSGTQWQSNGYLNHLLLAWQISVLWSRQCGNGDVDQAIRLVGGSCRLDG